MQPLASKKVYLFFYGCLGIIQGMFFTYLRLIELIRLKLPNIHMTDHRGQIVGQFRIYKRMDQTQNRLKILHSGSKCQKVWIEEMSAKLTPFDFVIPTQL